MNTLKNQSWRAYSLIFMSFLVFSGNKLQSQSIWGSNLASKVELWLKADSGVITKSGNVINYWNDYSGYSRQFINRNDNIPTYNQTSNLMNFNPSINFNGTLAGKLISVNSGKYFLDTSNYYIVIYVSGQAAFSNTFQSVFSFTSGQDSAFGVGDDCGWYNGQPAFRSGAAKNPEGQNTPGNSYLGQNYKLYGITAVLVSNTTDKTKPSRVYKNGESPAVYTTVPLLSPGSSVVNPVHVIGSSGAGAGTANQFRGDIQEIIILSLPWTDSFRLSDFRKIHSYLSIKYGISLDNSVVGDGNFYYAANGDSNNGTVVWSQTDNTGYNSYIFGIGRDSISGLYQKQSKNTDEKAYSPTVYVGTLETLNSQNKGTLENMQYLMLGATGAYDPVFPKPFTGAGTGTFENGSIDHSKFNIQSPVYKAQLTGPSTITVKFKPPVDNFTRILVSKDPNFPEGSNGTRIYDLTSGVTLGNGYIYIKFIGYKLRKTKRYVISNRSVTSIIKK